MITLYHAPGSCSLAVKAALALSGLEYEVKIVNAQAGEQFAPEFIKINPLSKVPALIVDGHIITEGAAILQYISELAPNTNLLPEAGTMDRAQALKWMMFVYSNVHPHFSRAFIPARYGDNEIDVKEKAESALHDLFAVINEQLAENNYIAGATLSIADLYLGVAIHWQMILKDSLSGKHLHIDSYLQRLLDHPIIGNIYKSEFS
ncbi:MAG: glutathione S-transferase [Oceanospirillaceae bacterium]|jgi:glutathione S-transferase